MTVIPEIDDNGDDNSSGGIAFLLPRPRGEQSQLFEYFAARPEVSNSGSMSICYAETTQHRADNDELCSVLEQVSEMTLEYPHDSVSELKLPEFPVRTPCSHEQLPYPMEVPPEGGALECGDVRSTPEILIRRTTSWQAQRGRSNSFLVQNAPRLPTSPDMSIDEPINPPPPCFSPFLDGAAIRLRPHWPASNFSVPQQPVLREASQNIAPPPMPLMQSPVEQRTNRLKMRHIPTPTSFFHS